MLDDKYQQEIDRLVEKYDVEPIKINVFDCLTSTNHKLWQLIDNGIKIPATTIALQQTAGKGQWGKNWQSGRGGLYLSVALKCDLALENSFHLVMATAEGITNILRDYRLPITIKWSNDLILDSRKLGGIKIETKTQNNRIKYAVVGVGINWRNPVPEIGINLQSYYQKQDTNKPLQYIKSLEKLAAIAIIGVLKGDRDYQQLGISYTHQKYQNLLNIIGKQITIDRRSGTIMEVTPEGKLKIRLQSPGASTNIYLSPGEISLGYDLA